MNAECGWIRLDLLGVAFESAWEDGFAALAKFKAREGHCLVPARHTEGTVKLGIWASRQRKSRDILSVERRKRLDKIGFVWDPHERDWEEDFAALTKFKAREGHCRVPQNHVEEGVKLANWVGWQRKGRSTLPAERKKRLDAIGFVWDPLEEAWEEGFAALRRFKAREGHCRVPAGHIEGTLRLGQWVSNQRARREMFPAERKKRLDAIGFVWDPFESDWEEGLAALGKFKAREGHCRVPLSDIEGKFKLGQWVGDQRERKDAMLAKRRERLNKLGFVWRLKQP